MKTAPLILASLLALALASCARARPAEADAPFEAADAGIVVPTEPVIDEGHEEGPLEIELIRERRSPQKKERGNVDVSVHREKGVGTIVQAQGQGNIWSSKDGRTRLDAQGQWSKVVRGPARAKPNYNAGITFTHRF